MRLTPELTVALNYGVVVVVVVVVVVEVVVVVVRHGSASWGKRGLLAVWVVSWWKLGAVTRRLRRVTGHTGPVVVQRGEALLDGGGARSGTGPGGTGCDCSTRELVIR